jgi:Predicted membrane protein
MHIVEPNDIAIDVDVYRRATYLGIVAGLRSMTPVALLAWSSANTAKTTKNITAALAIGELIADKLPFTPGRLQKGPFTGRLVIGAITGALLCRRAKQSVLQGALRGAVGAALGSIAGYVYRVAAADLTDIPDITWALLEDGTAILLGANVTGIIQPADTAKTRE